eukprot:TRINITY_DN21285_c0_g1_i4.p1 TRINITY_DN21285_c0_g1~~TRINITY_DN21285_c0_g1_i4.p1  ORF type:complete len:689 (+),score=77.18 TRINITY_DN21285_c0_g1_i4:175-2067(+)
MSHFEERYAKLLAWCHHKNDGSLPKRNASDDAERILATFLKRLQARHRIGRLGSDEIELLRRVPGLEVRLESWGIGRGEVHVSSGPVDAEGPETPPEACSGLSPHEVGVQPFGPKRSVFDHRYASLLVWAEQRADGTLPSQGSLDETERSLASYMNGLQKRHRLGKLNSVQIDLLRKVPGMDARLGRWKSMRASAHVCPLCKRSFKSQLLLRHHGSATCRRALVRPGKLDKLFMWWGGKYPVRDFILGHIPQECKLIVSPFFGSGAVELRLLRERPAVRVVASDLTISLVRFWQAMLASPGQVADEVAKLLSTDRIVRADEFNTWADAIRQESSLVKSEPDKVTAARFYCVNQIAFSAKMQDVHYMEALAQRSLRFREKRLRQLRAFVPPGKGRLRLSQRDCFEAIATCPKDSLLFLDPPYMSSECLERKPHLKHDGLLGAQYPCGPNWGLVMHTKLRRALGAHERWIVCHEEHPQIRELYADCQIVLYMQSSYIGGTKRHELLILSPWVSQRLDPDASNNFTIATGLKYRLRSKMPLRCGPVQQWEVHFERSLKELELWVAQNGRGLPQCHSQDDIEKKLYSFIGTRARMLYRKGVLGASVLQRMKKIPGLADRIASWGKERPCRGRDD